MKTIARWNRRREGKPGINHLSGLAEESVPDQQAMLKSEDQGSDSDAVIEISRQSFMRGIVANCRARIQRRRESARAGRFERGPQACGRRGEVVITL